LKNKKPVQTVNKPSALLYFMLMPFLKLYYRMVFKHTVDRSGIRSLKPPYLVVAGHASWLDYMITSAAMFPVRMNYVGAYNFFRDKVLKTLFGFMGVIPKYQFTNDLAAIKKMKYCIDQGRVVMLFPHGCLSNEGRPGGFAVFGIAKLVKFLNVPVVALKTDGAYLTRPRWTKYVRRGRMHTTASLILTQTDVQSLTNEQIYKAIMEAIDFDDYRWQRENQVPYKGKNTAEGLEYILYKCPKCKSEFTLRSQGNRFYCTACGNEAQVNRFLMFEQVNECSIIFEGIDQWYDYQKTCIDSEIKNSGFMLKAKTELRHNESGKYGYQLLGQGELTLTRAAFIYTGEISGEPAKMVLPLKNIPMIPYAANEYIEVAEGSRIHRFIFEDKTQMIKWVMAVRQLRDEYYETEKIK